MKSKYNRTHNTYIFFLQYYHNKNGNTVRTSVSTFNMLSLWLGEICHLLQQRSAVEPAPIVLNGLPERLAVHEGDVGPHRLVEVLGQGQAQRARHVPA